MNYWKRLAIFTLKDDKGRFLLLLRDKDDKFLPHHWALVGGSIEEGETPEEAVMREAEEEIGIKPNLKFFRKYDDLYCKGNHYQAYVFIGKLNHSLEELKKKQTEGEDLGLFSMDEIENLKIHGGDMTVWKDIFEYEKVKKGFNRSVAIFVLIDDKNRFLLQHKDVNAPYLPNHWAFFGGGIEEGETPEQAVMREAYEELEIKPELKFLKRYEWKHRGKEYESFVFVGRLNYSLEQLKKQLKEGDDVDLFSFDEIKNLKMIKDDVVILGKMIKIINDIFKNEKK